MNDEVLPVHCDMGVGCDEVGVCYAAAHGEPWRCPKAAPLPGELPDENAAFCAWWESVHRHIVFNRTDAWCGWEARAALSAAQPVAWLDPEYHGPGQPYGKHTSPVTTFEVNGWTPLYDAAPTAAPLPEPVAQGNERILKAASRMLVTACKAVHQAGRLTQIDDAEADAAEQAFVDEVRSVLSAAPLPGELLEAVDAVLAANRVALLNGGGAWARHTLPAINKLQVARSALSAAQPAQPDRDTERLDWLEKQGLIGIGSVGYGDYRRYAGDGFKPLRAVVDAEMQDAPAQPAQEGEPK